MKRTLSTLVALWCMCCTLYAANIDTQTRIFDPSFRSLKVSVDEDFFAAAAICAGSQAHVVVSFDQIADDVAYLRYRILHCNADWQPSNLLEPEFVDGFNLAPVSDYAFSVNTFVHFVNYRILLPNQEMTPLVSGNYLLQVFPEEEPDSTLLQARFCVSDEQALIDGNVLTVTDRGVNDQYQQLELVVDLLGSHVQNPMTDIIITVEQNLDKNSIRRLPPPMRVAGSRLFYEHQPQLIFDAGNEYRRFETSAIPQTGMHVDSTRFLYNCYSVYLTPDLPRTANYVYDQTQQGRFKVRQINAIDADLGADYVDVNFELRIQPQPGVNVMVQGEMTEALPQQSTVMTYDYDRQAYLLSLPLKQGAYNYRYVVQPTDRQSVQAAPVEGNHYQTRNEYTVKVYHRPPNSRGDRLLAVRTIRNY